MKVIDIYMEKYHYRWRMQRLATFFKNDIPTTCTWCNVKKQYYVLKQWS